MANKPIIPIFFVSQDEYPKLQKLFPDEFKLPYEKWSQYIDKCNASIADEATPAKIYVNVDSFMAWCAASEIECNANARPVYVAHLHQINPNGTRQ